MARNREQLDRVASRCREAGSPEVWVGSHDLAEEQACVDAVKGTVGHFGSKSEVGHAKVNFLSPKPKRVLMTHSAVTVCVCVCVCVCVRACVRACVCLRQSGLMNRPATN